MTTPEDRFDSLCARTRRQALRASDPAWGLAEVGVFLESVNGALQVLLDGGYNRKGFKNWDGWPNRLQDAGLGHRDRYTTLFDTLEAVYRWRHVADHDDPMRPGAGKNRDALVVLAMNAVDDIRNTLPPTARTAFVTHLLEVASQAEPERREIQLRDILESYPEIAVRLLPVLRAHLSPLRGASKIGGLLDHWERQVGEPLKLWGYALSKLTALERPEVSHVFGLIQRMLGEGGLPDDVVQRLQALVPSGPRATRTNTLVPVVVATFDAADDGLGLRELELLGETGDLVRWEQGCSVLLAQWEDRLWPATPDGVAPALARPLITLLREAGLKSSDVLLVLSVGPDQLAVPWHEGRERKQIARAYRSIAIEPQDLWVPGHWEEPLDAGHNAAWFYDCDDCDDATAAMQTHTAVFASGPLAAARLHDLLEQFDNCALGVFGELGSSSAFVLDKGTREAVFAAIQTLRRNQKSVHVLWNDRGAYPHHHPQSLGSA